jgi:hypothetical protein
MGINTTLRDFPRIRVHFTDQEPLYNSWLEKLSSHPEVIYTRMMLAQDPYLLTIIAVSEHSSQASDLRHAWAEDKSVWYYFYHGFAALDWYRNIRYLPPVRQYSKLFISFNNLFENKRSYRLNLIARLCRAGVDKLGYISINQERTQERIRKEIFSSTSELSVDSKKIIYENLPKNIEHMVIDTHKIKGSLSADDNLNTLARGLFHVVTETIFYDNKLHLTEKIFKPIVVRRPFFLVCAPGNLAYLKSYGFRTFDRWLDESYDTEPDPDRRIQLIVDELVRLSQLSPAELDAMYQDMQETLDFNHNYFYTGFRERIVEEMLHNFEVILAKHNHGLRQEYKINTKAIDLESVKKLLLQ